MNKQIFLTVLLLIATMSVSAQTFKGDISPLKNQKEVNVVLDFTGTLCEGMAKEKYIEIKTKGKSEEQKAQFLSELNEQLQSEAYNSLTGKMDKVVNEKWFSAGNYPDAEYTIYVMVKDFNPGAFPMKNSRVRADVNFVKTGESVPIATVTYKNVLGRYSANVPLWVTRTVMAFGYQGESIGKVIVKNLK